MVHKGHLVSVTLRWQRVVLKVQRVVLKVSVSDSWQPATPK